MQQLEQNLEKIFVKNAPFQLPEAARQALAKAMPWLTLAGGIIMLWGAWALWRLYNYSDQITEAANRLGAMYGTGYVAPAGMGPLLWISLAVLLVEAVLFFIAFPALRDYKKKGWDILFWVSLVSAVQSVMQAVASGSFGTMIGSLLGSAIGLYLLFQIRSYYTGEKKVSAHPASPTMQVPKETPPTQPTSTDKK